MNVAIVGASARAAAYSTVRAGHSPIAADLFADGDLCDLCTTSVVRPYPDGFADWLATLDVDGWFYTGALENYPHLVDRLATLRPLWGNPGQVLQRVRDPWQLAAELQHDALRPPEMRRSVEGLPTDGSWLVKTNRGSSGSGVRSWRGPSVPSADYVAQRRMEGAPIGAVCVGNGSDARVLGITRQLIGCDWTGCGPFQYAGSIGPHETPARLREQIVRTARHLAQQFGLVGLFGIDVIVHQQEGWLLEVNPRYTASVEIVERMTGISALAAHVAACVDRQLRAGASGKVPNRVHWGKAILFASHDVRIAPTFHDWAIASSRERPWPSVADVPVTGTRIRRGRPVLTVFASGKSGSQVERRLRQRVQYATNLLAD